MALFDHHEGDNHEQILFCQDTPSGLRAIVAIHDTTLGPALGGCRMWPYASEEEALTDALRLSRGMTYKSALAGLPFGGGKSVIIGDPRSMKSPELFRAMGRCVDSLSGRYTVAEDVGISVADVETMAEETAHVAGVTAGGLRRSLARHGLRGLHGHQGCGPPQAGRRERQGPAHRRPGRRPCGLLPLPLSGSRGRRINRHRHRPEGRTACDRRVRRARGGARRDLRRGLRCLRALRARRRHQRRHTEGLESTDRGGFRQQPTRRTKAR